MKLSAFKETNIFYPEFAVGGEENLDLPEKERVGVKIKYPNFSEKQRLQQLFGYRGGDKFGISNDAKETLEKHCLEVYNLEYQITEGNKKGEYASVRNGKDLAKSSHPIVQQIAQLVLNEILNPKTEDEIDIEGDEEIKKNSE